MSRSVAEVLREAFARVLGVASEHRRGLGAITLGVVAGAFLLAAQPWSAQSYDLGDSGAWLNRGQEIGRLNTQIGEIDFVGGDQLEGTVLQDGRTPYLVTGDEVKVLDPRDPTMESESVGVAVADRENDVVAGGGVVVAKSGEQAVLVVRDGAVVGSPLMEVGDGGAVAVGVDGTAVGVDPERGVVLVSAPDSEEPRRDDISKVDGAIQVAMVGDRPVVLDVEGRRLLRVGEDPVDIDASGPVLLQRSGPAAEIIRVAVDGALLEVPLGGGDVRRRSVEGQAIVRPAVDPDGCALGAWRTAGSVSVGAFCDGDRSVVLPDAADGQWSMRGSSARPVLNETTAGAAYYLEGDRIRAVTEEWPEDKATISPTRNFEDRPPNPEGTSKPIAVNDDMFARLGRTANLDLLWNDVDEDGDALLIHQIDAPEGLVRVADGGRRVAVTVPADSALRTLTFEYTVHDGKQASEPAKVTVTVRDDDGNEAPRLKANYETGVAFRAQTGQQVDVDALSYFWDPDGDPMYLASVSSPSTQTVAVDWQASGGIRFTGVAPGVAEMTATVRDDRADDRPAAGLPVTVNVDDAADLPPVINHDVAQVIAGQTVRIEPLANDVDPGGNDLVLVQELRELDGGDRAEVSVDREVVSVTASGAGQAEPDYVRVLYEVEQAADPARTRYQGLILVKVIPSEEALPEALPDVVTVPLGRRAAVDLLANDADPRGALLAVTGVQSLSGPTPGLVTALGSDLRTFGVDALTSAAPGTVATFEYKVTNGRSQSASSTVTVIVEDARPNRLPRPVISTPIAVRAGDVVTVPFARFVEDPDGDRMVVALSNQDLEPHVRPDAESVRVFAPAAWAGQQVVVDLIASDASGSPQATTFTLDVTSLGANAPPVAEDLEARVRVGGSVVIPIRATDPDGDSVRLVGRTACGGCQPLGGDVRVDPERQAFIYTATDDAASGGSFTYAVVDSAGQQSNDATVRVLVAPRESGNQPPVAAVDRVVARADSTVFVDPTANDVDGDGDLIVLDRASVELRSGACTVASPPDDGPALVSVETGEPGECTIAYRVVDALAETPEKANSSPVEGLIIVSVLSDFAGVPPIARDDFPERTDLDSVVVDVLANDEDPDGAPGGLEVSVVDAPAGVSASDGRLTIALDDEARLVRYRITDPQRLTADAMVRVPGRKENRPPELVGGADPLSVNADATEPLEIELSELINDPDGDDLVFADAVAPKADPTVLESRLGDGVVLFQPVVADFSGVATLQVRATDTGTPPLGEVFTFTVEILPRENRQPEWSGDFSVTVPKGGSITPRALRPYVVDPDPRTELVFSGGGTSSGVEATVSKDGLLSVTAEDRAEIGATVRVALEVTDGESEKVEQEWSIKVVRSEEEPPVASAGTARVQQGDSVTVDTTKLVTSAQGAVTVEAAELQSGAPGDVTPSGSSFTYTADADFAGEVVVRYTVVDAQHEDDNPRRASSLVTIQVIGRPDPPTITKVTPGNGTVTVAFSYGDYNGGAPKPFQVRQFPSGPVSAECDASPCVLDRGDRIVNGATYQFVAIADNEVGPSEPSAPSEKVTPDAPPTTPTGLKASVVKTENDNEREGTVEFSWSPVTGEFTDVTHYIVTVSGRDPVRVDAKQTSYPVRGPHGGLLCATVAAVNKLQQPSPPSVEECGTPYGDPFVSGPVTFLAVGDGQIEMSFTVDPNGREARGWSLSGCTPVPPVADKFENGLRIEGQKVDCAGAGDANVVLRIDGVDGWSELTQVVKVLRRPQLTGTLGVRAGLESVLLDLPSYEAGKFGGVPQWSYKLNDGGWAVLTPGSPATVDVPAWTETASVVVRVCNGPDLDLFCSNEVSGQLAGGEYVYADPPTPSLAVDRELAVDGSPTGSYTATAGWEAPPGAVGGYRVELVPDNGQGPASVNAPKSAGTVLFPAFPPARRATSYKARLCDQKYSDPRTGNLCSAWTPAVPLPTAPTP